MEMDKKLFSSFEGKILDKDEVQLVQASDSQMKTETEEIMITSRSDPNLEKEFEKNLQPVTAGPNGDSSINADDKTLAGSMQSLNVIEKDLNSIATSVSGHHTEEKLEAGESKVTSKMSTKQLVASSNIKDSIGDLGNIEFEQSMNLEENLTEEDKRKLLTIAKCLGVAVKGKEYQASILKDESYTQLLVLWLMEDSIQVVRSVMEVFEVLMSNRRNHIPLQKLPYFTDVLKKMSLKENVPVDLQQDALKMLRTLHEVRAPLNDCRNSLNNSVAVNPSFSTLERSKLRNGVETIFFIDNGVLQQGYGRNRIAKELIKVKGIISVTYDPVKSHCIVRRKRNTEPNLFGVAIANLGYDVSMICRNEKKDLIMVPIYADLNSGEGSKENRPDYLPEEDEELSVSENAVCKTGSSKDAKDKNNDGSLLDSAKSFLRKSFFW